MLVSPSSVHETDRDSVQCTAAGCCDMKHDRNYNIKHKMYPGWKWIKNI